MSKRTNQFVRLFAVLITAANPIWPQIIVGTFAGGTIRSGVPAQDVALSSITGLAWDAAGNLVFCDQSGDVIRRIRPDGTIETIAGNGITGFSGDGGPALSATLAAPASPGFDAQGNLYFYDSQNYRIRRIDTHGLITTIAGNGVPFVQGMDLEGPALQRSLTSIFLAVDPPGNVYFTEQYTDFVRRVTPAGSIEIFAGVSHPGGGTCSDGDGGPALAAKICEPSLLASDGMGNLYVAEEGAHIRRITPDGIIHTLTANFQSGISAMAADTAGNLYVIQLQVIGPPATPSGMEIRRVDPSGTTTTIAGGQYGPTSPDGPALPSSINPQGLAVDAHANVAFADNQGAFVALGGLVREVTPQAMLQTLAGANPTPAPDGTPARAAWFVNPVALAFNRASDLYIAERGPCLIRKIGAAGLFATVAGTGKCADVTSKNPSTDPLNLAPPSSIGIDSQNRLYMQDVYGNLYLISGDGKVAPAPFQPPLDPPYKFAIDSKDRVLLAGFFSLIRYAPDGSSQTILGLPSHPGPPPEPAPLYAIGIDPAGTVYFSASNGAGSPTDSVFRVNDDGTFSRLYGDPSNPIPLGIYHALAVDDHANVWLGTTVVNASGNSFLGLSSLGYSGDGGPAQSARFSFPTAAVSPKGAIYLLGGNRIRRLSGSGPASPPTIAAVVNAASYTGGGIASGELLSIFGSNFGTTALQVNAPENNQIPYVLGRTKVLFNGSAGSIAAITPNQINVFAPPYLYPGYPVDIVVQVDATPSAPFTVPATAAAPGLAAADESGSGQGAILNQDSSFNSTANPAARGSIISMFGTGEGAISPLIPSGYLSISTPFSLFTQPTTVTIGGQPAEILYAGEAPFEPVGGFQINARIPATISPGNAPVTVSIGGIATSKLITVAVQ